MNVTVLDDDREGQDDDDGINNNVAIILTYYALVLVIGIPGNVIILLIYGRKKRKTSTDVLIIGQGIVDFLACVFTPALIIRSCFYSLVTTGLCRFAYLAETSGAFMSLFFTTVISVDRYLAVCRPLRRHGRLTKRSSILASMVVVGVGVAINIPGTVFEVASSELRGDKCTQTISYMATLMMSVAFVLIFALSLITSSIMYMIIYAFLQKRAKIHDKLVGNTVPIATIQPSKVVKSLVTADSLTSNFKMHIDNSLFVENISTDITSIKTDNLSPTANFLPYSAGSTRLSRSDPMSKRTHLDPDGSCQAVIVTHGNAQSPPYPSQPRKQFSRPSFLSRLCRRQLPNRARASKSKESDMGRKTTRMLLVITVYFFATWMPQIVYSVLSKNVLIAIDRNRVLDTIFEVLTALRLTNHIVNAFVYSVINDGFRTSLRQMFSLSRKK
ncbi:somatostatin receptor type 2-like [Strongylocentrotus purpuratus]|uniref:G-protein coupled receptors family 1 profile domain-containing protein n=1 Tax=Strongylocentrotus purpuratus TaxID=7668 RepID=A0A7M7NS07_STRPU|nr:somatostatin receptor type 2-like [Strongylocentrotus purpuratus]